METMKGDRKAGQRLNVLELHKYKQAQRRIGESNENTHIHSYTPQVQ